MQDLLASPAPLISAGAFPAEHKKPQGTVQSPAVFFYFYILIKSVYMKYLYKPGNIHT